ncbi:hypothetical protein [Thermofilum sp.]|uniref:hypothetical protein n=1 Tax=Thermofilum sp. TaxID=1961369 RepID=UPI00316C6587
MSEVNLVRAYIEQLLKPPVSRIDEILDELKKISDELKRASEQMRILSEQMSDLALYLIKPEGISVPINVSVSNILVIDFIKDYPNKRLFSISLINDGPDEVYIGVNSVQTTTPTKANEAASFDYKAPRIARLYLYTGPGKTAKVRGEGVC